MLAECVQDQNIALSTMTWITGWWQPFRQIAVSIRSGREEIR